MYHGIQDYRFNIYTDKSNKHGWRVVKRHIYTCEVCGSVRFFQNCFHSSRFVNLTASDYKSQQMPEGSVFDRSDSGNTSFQKGLKRNSSFTGTTI